MLPTLADKKNHTIDALRYAIEKARRTMSGWGVFEYTRRLAEEQQIPLPSAMKVPLPSDMMLLLPSQLPPPDYGFSFAPRKPDRLVTMKVPKGTTNVHRMSGQMYHRPQRGRSRVAGGCATASREGRFRTGGVMFNVNWEFVGAVPLYPCAFIISPRLAD